MTGSIRARGGILLVALTAQAPVPPLPTNLIEEVHRLYHTPVQNSILRAAEQFPEDKCWR